MTQSTNLGPPRIRTDTSNAFAHHTMRVRVPAIIDRMMGDNPEYPEPLRERLMALRHGLSSDGLLPSPDLTLPHAVDWHVALEQRRGERWLGTDWFFAENYVYRLIAEATLHFQSGHDPFLPVKLREYSSAAYRRALDAAAALAGEPSQLFEELLGCLVFGNRMDASYAPSHALGVDAGASDLLLDDRRAAVRLLLSGQGPVHLIADNVGTELSLDLVLISRVMEVLKAPVVLHVKVHPAFVSDATVGDVQWLLGLDALPDPPPGLARSSRDSSAATLWAQQSVAAQNIRAQLSSATTTGQLQIRAHPFWNGPRSLAELPGDLRQAMSGARLVLLKGDAHYRRAVNDADWPPGVPFASVTADFPCPLLSLRTLKSDPIVGLSASAMAALDRIDPSWRVNGQRAVACLGGRPAR